MEIWRKRNIAYLISSMTARLFIYTMDLYLRRTGNFAINIYFLSIPVCSRSCTCLDINNLQTIWNKSVIRVLPQYNWNADMKIHRKESQPHFSGFRFNFFSFIGFAVHEIDLWN